MHRVVVTSTSTIAGPRLRIVGSSLLATGTALLALVIANHHYAGANNDDNAANDARANNATASHVTTLLGRRLMAEDLRHDTIVNDDDDASPSTSTSTRTRSTPSATSDDIATAGTPAIFMLHVFGTNRYGLVDPMRSTLSTTSASVSASAASASPATSASASASPATVAAASSSASTHLSSLNAIPTPLNGLSLAQKHAAAVDSHGNLWQWGALFARRCEGGSNALSAMLDEERVPLQSENALVHQERRSPVYHAVAVASNVAFPSHAPACTLRGKRLTQVACAEQEVFALSSGGSVFRMSANLQQQQYDESPRVVQLGKEAYWRERITTIEAGSQHVVALTNYGRVFTAACHRSSGGALANASGQLALGHGSGGVAPLEFHLVQGLASIPIAQIACGDEHTLARSCDGKVYGWGSNILGQLAQPAADINIYPEPIELTAPLSTVAPPAVDRDDRRGGAVGVAPAADAVFTDVVAAGSTSYFVRDSRTTTEVFACGFGQYGQLGGGQNLHVANRPLRVRTISNLREYDESTDSVQPIRIARLAAGPHHAFAVLHNRYAGNGVADDTTRSDRYGYDVLSWGSNIHGECLHRAARVLPVPMNVELASVESTSTEDESSLSISVQRLQLMPKQAPLSWLQWLGVTSPTASAEPATRIAVGNGVTAFY